MKKLQKGDWTPVIDEVSVTGKRIQIPAPDIGFVHLQFRRFAGCPICNLHLMELSRRMADLTAANIREVVVFHSAKEELLEHQSLLQFECIADPDKRLYRKFGVETSFLSLLHPAALWSGIRAVWTTRRIPTQAENGVLGLPADFLIGPTGRIEALHYGSHAYDNWDADTILRIAREAGSTMNNFQKNMAPGV